MAGAARAGAAGVAAAVVAAVVALGVTQVGDGDDAPSATGGPGSPGDAGTSSGAGRASGEPYRVLFDAAHGQQAGNADWVVSTSMPDPLEEDPEPGREDDWTGALSSWGVALAGYPARYRLATNPPGRPLSHGEAGNGLDLTEVDVLVLPEPNRALSEAERRAVVAHVAGGGGLFLVVDHARSDRDGDGIDSVGVGNQLLDAFTDRGLPTGLEVDVDDVAYENTDNLAAGAEDHPVVDGAWGRAASSILRGGTTLTLDPGANPDAACLLYRDGVADDGREGCFLARSEIGSGRLLVWGDSSPIDDGTGDPGDRLYANFGDPRDTNEAWALNGTDWLAGGPVD